MRFLSDSRGQVFRILIGSVTILFRQTWFLSSLIQFVIFFFSDKLSWSRLLISECFMFVPLNLGRRHWILIALDSRHRSRCAVFWDPLGYRCHDEIRYKLTNFFVGFTWTDVQSRIQHDGFQCGVWVCWAVETFTSLLRWTVRTGTGPLFGMRLISLLRQTAWLILSLT